MADTEKSGTATKLITAVPQGFGRAGVTTLHALTVTICAAGIDGGAVYSPVALIVPTLGLRLQVTLPLGVPVTRVVNCCVAPGVRLAAEGVTVTEMGVRVTCAWPQTLKSIVLHAFAENVCEARIGLGAVYRPL